MKKLFSIFALAAAAFALTSCQSEADEVNPAPQQGNEIRISAQVGDYTRVEGTSFENGDEVSLIAYNGEAKYIDNALFSYADGAFTSEKSYYWPEQEGAELDFYAIYPYGEGYGNELTISAQLDQTEHAAYSLSDVMVAYTKAAYNGSAVNLAFARQNVKLVFNLDNKLEEGIASLKVSNLYNAAVVALDPASEKGYTLTESTDNGAVEFTAAKLSNGEWVLIVPAQKAAKPVLTVVTASGVEYKYEVTNGQDLASGYYYTANITIEAPVTPDPGPGPEPEPDPIAIEITWSIADWEAGDELEFIQEGVEQEPEQPEVIKATVAEFLAAAEDATIYELTGTITGTYNIEYGNFYLEDETGKVLVYGLLSPDGQAKVQYAAAGLQDGYKLTIQGARTSHNGTAQMKNATYVSHEVVEVEKPDADLTAKSDDFGTLTNSSSYGTFTTVNGWVGENCAVQSGGSGDSNPVFESLLGSDASVKGLTMNGKTSAVGKITSPVLPNGCGTLSLNYGYCFSEANGVSFKVEIMQNGSAVQSYDVVDKSLAKLAKGSWSQEVNVTGDFQIVITNNSPSASTSNKDRYTIFNIAWTAAE